MHISRLLLFVLLFPTLVSSVLFARGRGDGSAPFDQRKIERGMKKSDAKKLRYGRRVAPTAIVPQAQRDYDLLEDEDEEEESDRFQAHFVGVRMQVSTLRLLYNSDPEEFANQLQDLQREFVEVQENYENPSPEDEARILALANSINNLRNDRPLIPPLNVLHFGENLPPVYFPHHPPVHLPSVSLLR
jgi:hypothetical protein